MGALFFLMLTLNVAFFSKKVFYSYLSPLSVYALIWGTMLFLFHLHLALFSSLYFFTYFVILGSYFSFAIGSLTSKLFFLHTFGLNTTHSLERRYPYSISYRKLDRIFVIVSAISLIGSLYYLVTIYRYWGLETVILSPATMRDYLTAHSIEVGSRWWLYHFTVGSMYVGASIGGIYIGTDSKKYPLMRYSALLAAIIFCLGEFSRSKLVSIMLFYVISFWLSKKLSNKRITLKGIIPLGFIGIIVFTFVVLIQLFRGIGIEENYIPYVPDKLEDVFLRLTVPLAFLNEKLHLHSGEFYYGYATFQPFMTLLKKIGLLQEYIRIVYIDYNPITGWEGYSTPTYLQWFYDDFGLLGIMVVPYFLGLIMTWIYIYTIKMNTITLIPLLTNFYDVIISSQGTWRLYDTFIWVSLFFAVIIFVSCKRRKK